MPLLQRLRGRTTDDTRAKRIGRSWTSALHTAISKPAKSLQGIIDNLGSDDEANALLTVLWARGMTVQHHLPCCTIR